MGVKKGTNGEKRGMKRTPVRKVLLSDMGVPMTDMIFNLFQVLSIILPYLGQQGVYRYILN